MVCGLLASPHGSMLLSHDFGAYADAMRGGSCGECSGSAGGAKTAETKLRSRQHSWLGTPEHYFAAIRKIWRCKRHNPPTMLPALAAHVRRPSCLHLVPLGNDALPQERGQGLRLFGLRLLVPATRSSINGESSFSAGLAD